MARPFRTEKTVQCLSVVVRKLRKSGTGATFEDGRRFSFGRMNKKKVLKSERLKSFKQPDKALLLGLFFLD